MANTTRGIYTIASRGIVPGLGINAPVTTPVYIDDIYIVKMLRQGYEIYKHNPYDTREKVRININNFNNIYFDQDETLKKLAAERKAAREKEEMKVNVAHKPVVENKYKDYNNKKKKDKKDNKPENNTQPDKVEGEISVLNTPDGFTKQ